MAPLIVIAGPTASGKTALAIRLAERWGGEIICADSRTVYKGLDIGTAKPTVEERAAVPHHALDLVEIDDRFTAYDFQRYAYAAIDAIRTRGKIPFLVGGTGLYIDSVVLHFSFVESIDQQRRQELESYSVTELQTMIKKQHIQMPENDQNRRHLIRQLERQGGDSSRIDTPDATTNIVAITTDKNVLSKRIEKRIRAMFAAGVVDEARSLAEKFGWNHEVLRGNVYQAVNQYYFGKVSLEEAIQLAVVRDRQLAKRQLTWLRRHPFIQWQDISSAEHYFDHILRNYRDAHPQ